MPISELPLSYHELEEQNKTKSNFSCLFVLFLLLVIFIICYYLYTGY